jgi:hypothetical protein
VGEQQPQVFSTADATQRQVRKWTLSVPTLSWIPLQHCLCLAYAPWLSAAAAAAAAADDDDDVAHVRAAVAMFSNEGPVLNGVAAEHTAVAAAAVAGSSSSAAAAADVAAAAIAAAASGMLPRASP